MSFWYNTDKLQAYNLTGACLCTVTSSSTPSFSSSYDTFPTARDYTTKWINKLSITNVDSNKWRLTHYSGRSLERPMGTRVSTARTSHARSRCGNHWNAVLTVTLDCLIFHDTQLNCPFFMLVMSASDRIFKCCFATDVRILLLNRKKKS
jgi:hypothetical protein